ncbi:response regulator [candidate division KSB1 bacterium]|nr:response regulator [candidate division KSB1 bacterium]
MSETRTATILLVEDEPGHVELIRRAFENYPHQWRIDSCGSILEARQKLDAQLPMAILLDHKLPDGTGLQFLNEIANGNLLPAPIIMLTSHGNEDLAVRAIRLGAEDYIVKSDEGFRNITQRVEQAIQHWQAKKEMRELQLQLKQSEAQIRAYLAATSDLFCHIGLDGSLLYINDSGLKLVGYDAASLYGDGWKKIISQPYPIETRRHLVRLVKHEATIRNVPIALENQQKQGLLLEINANCLKVEDQPQGYVVTGRDVTHRKQAEMEREQLLHDLNQRVRELTCLYAIEDADKTNDNLAALLLEITRNIDQAMQYPRHARAYIHLHDKIYSHKPLSRKKAASLTAEISVSDVPIGSLEVIYTKNHHFLPEEQHLIQEIAKRLGKMMEHRRIQQELLNSEQKYRTLIYHMQDAMMLISRTGKILEVNPAFLELIGCDQNSLDKLSVPDLFQLPQVDEAGLNVSQNDKYLKDFPVAINTASGEKKIVELSSKPISDEHGEILFNEIIIHDVTARKKLETALIRSKVKAEEANKMKTAFFHNISHELRTPLNAIIGFTQLLLQKNIPSDVREMLEYISVSGNNLKIIIDELLDITRIEAGKTSVNFTPVVTNELINYLKHEFQKELMEKGLMFETRVSPKVPNMFISDNLRLQQILSNLVANALKFTSRGRISLSVDMTGDKLLFAVSDTGIGIALEDQKRIFDDFVQVDSSDSKVYGGIGLGLAISKRIAELLHGEIWVRSQLKRGTTFYVTIPIVSSATVDRVIESGITETPGAEKNVCTPKTLLLADDDPLGRKLIENAVKPWGWNVLMVTNGKEALNTLYTVFVDLIILDLQMPILDGFETAHQIRNNPFLASIPIIAVSALVSEADRAHCFESGCSDFISKPIDLVRLKVVIEKWSQQINEKVGS